MYSCNSRESQRTARPYGRFGKAMNDYQPLPMSPDSGGYSHSTEGASTRVQLAKEELICALCMMFYRNPRSLQCLHSYCEECLQELHQSSRCTDTVQCPECRARTLLPGEGIQGLPTNFKLKRFVEILTSEEKKEFMKALSNKKPGVISQLQCSRHPERPLEYYCETCKLLICGQCMISEHRAHGQINYAVNVLSLHIKLLRNHLPAAKSIVAQGLSAIESIESHECELKQRDEERVAEVEQYFAEMHHLLEEREREILDSFQGELRHKMKLLTKRRHILQDSIECVRKSMFSIEDVAERRADDIRVLIEEDSVKGRLHARMKTMETEIKSTQKSLAPLQLGFNPDPAMEMLCKSVGGDLQSSEPKFKLVRADTSPMFGDTGNPFNKPRAHSSGDVFHPDVLNTKRGSIDSGDMSNGAQKQRQLGQMPSLTEGEIQEPVCEISAKGLVGASRNMTPCPFGVALANDNNTFLVADIKNHNICIVTTGGKFLDRFGSEGKGDGQFLEPTAVATDPTGNIYVAEKGSFRVQKFSSTGKFITKFRTKGLMTSGNYLSDPMGIAVMDDGTVLVSDCEKACIQMFDDSGKYLGKFGHDDAYRLRHPAGITSKHGRVVIADRGNHCLWIYTSAGQLLARFGQQGTSPGDLYYPVGVAIDDDGNIFTSESGNHRISVFTAGGKFVRSFGRKGTDPGMFQNPRHLCFDPQNRLVVADEQNQRLQVFSVNINYYGTVGQRTVTK